MPDNIIKSFLIGICLVLLQHAIAYSQPVEGIASYYAAKFKGRKTTSGVKYHPDSLTAAHKNMAFGTRVKVTNLSNGRTVIVTINDRLPKKSKRSIDLSYAAAKKLDFIRAGLTKVQIEPIE